MDTYSALCKHRKCFIPFLYSFCHFWGWCIKRSSRCILYWFVLLRKIWFSGLEESLLYSESNVFFLSFPMLFLDRVGFYRRLQGERMHLLLWETVWLACGAQVNKYSQICRKPVFLLISIVSFQLIFGQSETHLCLFNMYYTFLKAIDVEI